MWVFVAMDSSLLASAQPNVEDAAVVRFERALFLPGSGVGQFRKFPFPAAASLLRFSSYWVHRLLGTVGRCASVDELFGVTCWETYYGIGLLVN